MHPRHFLPLLPLAFSGSVASAQPAPETAAPAPVPVASTPSASASFRDALTQGEVSA